MSDPATEFHGSDGAQMRSGWFGDEKCDVCSSILPRRFGRAVPVSPGFAATSHVTLWVGGRGASGPAVTTAKAAMSTD